MHIKTLSYTDHATGWNLRPLSFEQLTLLVGASGVGKTRILASILNIKRISRGKSLNGIEWGIEFSSANGHHYRWKGAFENKGFSALENFEFIDFKEKEHEKPKIKFEQVYIDDKLIIDRDVDGIIFNGTKTVKLSLHESVISLLEEEDLIKDVHKAFDKVIFDDYASGTLGREFHFDEDIDGKLAKYPSIEAIRKSSESIKSKMYFAYKNQQASFNDIVQTFTDVFPHVEDVKIEPLADGGKQVPILSKLMSFIQIKEKDVDNWIDETRISSGMLRTLVHIAELYLCADSSLILIDEFENSLGVNCIDELTSSIVSAERDLQFIITSHHPYIINNIPHSHWKLIARKAGSVIAHDARAPVSLKEATSESQNFSQSRRMSAGLVI